MSFAALAWAAKQRTGGLATKAALLALANYADEHGCAYPSTAAIAAFGEMDTKTATAALDRLVAAGLIADTGNRQGHTKQIKVYRLALESHPETEAFQKRKPTASSVKDPQKRVTDTVKEPVPQKATPSSVAREPAKRGSTVSADFWPEPALGSLTAKAMADWPPGEIEQQIEHFIDLHTAKGTVSKDWQASWRTWVKNWRQFNGGRTRRTLDAQPDLRGPRPDPSLDLLRTARRAEEAEHSGGGWENHRGAWAALPAH